MKSKPPSFEALKKQSVPQLLFKCARLLNERAIARVNQGAGGRVLRAAHTALLPHLGPEGIRSSELAQRLDVSKQAVSQLVTELEDWGVVEQIPDPADGRAKLVRLTSRGQKAMLQGLAVLAELTEELSCEMGKRRMQELHTALLALESALE